MKYYYDLHIHSILSACADELMTPNNILNMAMLKGLDLLAITDHNSTKQLRTIQELEDSYDFLLIPGMELTVKEDFDILCYFKTFETAYRFDDALNAFRSDEWDNFNSSQQVVTDIYDQTKETIQIPLRKTTIPYNQVKNLVHKLGGIIVLAHIDRPSQTPLSTYSLDEIEFDGIEVQPHHKEEFFNQHPTYTSYKTLYNSDAHDLLMISEKEHHIELPELTVDAFFSYMKGDHNE